MLGLFFKKHFLLKGKKVTRYKYFTKQDLKYDDELFKNKLFGAISYAYNFCVR